MSHMIKPKEPRVMGTFRFPNGMVSTFDWNGQQIPELQGEYSEELLNKIKRHSDSKTKWNGFDTTLMSGI